MRLLAHLNPALTPRWLLMALLAVAIGALAGCAATGPLSVFGKIILIAQALEVGKSLERRALLWIVLGKSLIFAILLIAFHIVEGAIRAWFESSTHLGRSRRLRWHAAWPLDVRRHFLCRPYPIFAFQETVRILGSSALRDLFVRSGEKRFRLIER